MTYDQFDEMYDEDYTVQDAHMRYIQEHYDPNETAICDGDSLLVAQEQGYLYDEFRDFYINAHLGG